jgi:hypothetical protein
VPDRGRSVAGVTLCGLALALYCCLIDSLPEFCQRPAVGVAVGCLPSRRRIHQSLLHSRNRLTMTLPTDGAIPELPLCLRLRMDLGFICCNNRVSETCNDVAGARRNRAPVDAREQWQHCRTNCQQGQHCLSKTSCSSVCLVAEAPLSSPATIGAAVDRSPTNGALLERRNCSGPVLPVIQLHNCSGPVLPVIQLHNCTVHQRRKAQFLFV